MIYILLHSFRCVLWSRMWCILMNVPLILRRMCILLLLDEVVYRYQLYSCDGVTEFNYFLTDFLSTGSIHFWWRGVEICNYNSGCIYFPLQFYNFLSQVLWCSAVSTYMLRIVMSWELPQNDGVGRLWTHLLSQTHQNCNCLQNNYLWDDPKSSRKDVDN